jgi:heparosan-N-sulfate-glucuronate 5-epimerase
MEFTTEKYLIDDPFSRLWPRGEYYFTTGEDGIIQINYSETNPHAPDVTKQYHPTAISAYALSQFNMFLDSGDERLKNSFLKYADWLVDNLVDRGSFAAWNFNFNWESPGYKCKLPWISSMTQGLGISVLVRAWELTSQESYITAAERALSAFEVHVSRGGLLRTNKQGDIWYKGAPSPIGSEILNEVLFALIGLHEMHQRTGNSRAGELFDRGVDTLRKRLKDFNLNLLFFKWSRYDNKLLFYSGNKYHGIQTEQVKWLYQVTSDDIFAYYYQKWEGWQSKYDSKGRFTAKHLFELIYSLFYSRLLSFYTKYLQR